MVHHNYNLNTFASNSTPMKKITFLPIVLFVFFISSCGSIYKKQHGNGYTFIKHKKEVSNQIAKNKQPSIQEKSLIEITEQLKQQKNNESKQIAKQSQNLHKQIAKNKTTSTDRLLSQINAKTLNTIAKLKPDTVYRKEPAKKGKGYSRTPAEQKANEALIFAIAGLASFFILTLLSLIPTIIALSMVKKANAIAKISGEAMPEDARLAKIIAYIALGLNLFFLLLIILYIILIIVLLGLI